MELRLEKGKLGSTLQLLDRLSLKGKKSRHRTKIKKAIIELMNKAAEEEKDLVKEFANLGEDGEPILIEGDNGVKLWDIPEDKLNEFGDARKELNEEEAVIDGGDIEGAILTVKKVLDDIDIEFMGAEADTYDYVCEQLEKGTAKEKE